jgi:CRP/FNR family transcriptional regulator
MATDHGEHVSIESRHMPRCQHLPHKHIQCLLTPAKELLHDTNDVIVSAGQAADGVYVLMEGNARIVYLSGDARAVIGLMGKGELFGLAPALDGEMYRAQLEAMTPTRTLFVPRDEFIRELETHPEVATELLRQFSGYVRNVEEWLQGRI